MTLCTILITCAMTFPSSLSKSQLPSPEKSAQLVFHPTPTRCSPARLPQSLDGEHSHQVEINQLFSWRLMLQLLPTRCARMFMEVVSLTSTSAPWMLEKTLARVILVAPL